MNIVLFEREEFGNGPGDRVRLPYSDARVRHLRTVMKRDLGDRFRAGIIDGPRGVGEIEAAGAGSVQLRFFPQLDPEPSPPVRILLGHPRPIQLQRILRELAALGVPEIVVTHTELGERSYLQSTLWNSVRRLLVEGCSQGGGTRLPAVIREHTLKRAVAHLERGEPPPGSRMVLHPDPGGTRLSEPGGLDAPVVLAVGSERGWSAAELAFFEAGGYRRVRLGDRILRTEAAVVAGTAVLLARLGVL